ncbi:hypothetical protein IFM89_031576 [Coptis chinensis]|uniref:Uncharacterized protein n=1 Tax=Coptis chinensis TaxID=261450 RepID=A0A835HQX3_9MAGN|nr:hypothetical protein IFM89_031576 [Coptis chinensis]
MHAWFAAFVDTWYVVVVPIIGVQGFRWAIDNDRHGSFSIKEFDEQCLKLRVARGNLWHYSLSRRDLPDILLSTARSLFEQIIYAHKKSFGEEKYAEIRATFDCIHGHKNKYEKLQSLSSLIASSSHSRLTSSLDSFVMPLRELYLQSSSQDFLENLGHAWLHVGGGLRFQLLLTPDDLDPAIKYSIKHSQVVEKISLLGLEIKVCLELHLH